MSVKRVLRRESNKADLVLLKEVLVTAFQDIDFGIRYLRPAVSVESTVDFAQTASPAKKTGFCQRTPKQTCEVVRITTCSVLFDSKTRSER